jgi:hypothetical protein
LIFCFTYSVHAVKLVDSGLSIFIRLFHIVGIQRGVLC